MTCLSCECWRSKGCYIRKPGFPKIGQRCKWFIYEPGAGLEDLKG